MQFTQQQQYFFDSIDFAEDHTFWIKSNLIINKKIVYSKIKKFEGTLFIKSSKSEFWKSRFFILYTDRLEVYKNGRDRNLIATMFLTQIYLDQTPNENDKFSITFMSQGKKFILNARTQESKEKWLKQFQQTCILLNYRECYLNLKVMGKGSFAKVLLAQHSKTRQKFAVKTFQKSNLINQHGKQRIALLNEVQLLRLCDHPNIIKLFEIYESSEYIYLVMELLEGGDLFDLILENGQFKEQQIAIIMKKILNALEYLHFHNIIHRDLKPENIILKEPLKDRLDQIDFKLADFGLATTTVTETQFKKCGSPGYVAPEILQSDQKYDTKVDIFSAGVIFYILLTGISPFYADSLDEVLENNKRCLISFSNLKISPESLDLLKKLLESNPKYRLSAQEALQHHFFSQYEQKQIEDIDDPVIEETQNDHFSAFENMKRFQADKFQVKKLKDNLLICQTPLMNQKQADSWSNDSPQIQVKPHIFKQSPFDSDASILNTPSTPLSTKPDTIQKKQVNLGAVIFRKQSQIKEESEQDFSQEQIQQQQQIQNKKAQQVRIQLKKLDF